MAAQRTQLEAAFGPALQRQGGPEEEELLQGKFAAVTRTTLVPRETTNAPTVAPDPHGGALQRATNYDTVDGTTIVATVDDSANPMTMTGSLRQDATTVVDINGSLRYHVATIPKSAVSDSIFAFGTVRALEIETVDAVPQGRRIGQILCWHLARLASAQGIGYVTAGNVTAARGTFYTPLGFVDFKSAPAWATLVARKAHLEQQMAGPAAPPDAIIIEYHSVNALMTANKVFISAADLEAHALARWSAQWRLA